MSVACASRVVGVPGGAAPRPEGAGVGPTQSRQRLAGAALSVCAIRLGGDSAEINPACALAAPIDSHHISSLLLHVGGMVGPYVRTCLVGAMQVLQRAGVSTLNSAMRQRARGSTAT